MRAFIACPFGTVLLDLPIFLLVPLLLRATLARIRKGKATPGLLRHLAYKSGALWQTKLVLPNVFTAPYMVPPVWSVPGRGIVFLTPHRLFPDRIRPFMRFYLNSQRWLLAEPPPCGGAPR